MLAKINVHSRSAAPGSPCSNQFRVRDLFIGNVLDYDTNNAGDRSSELTDTIFIEVDNYSQIQFWFRVTNGSTRVSIRTIGFIDYNLD